MVVQRMDTAADSPTIEAPLWRGKTVGRSCQIPLNRNVRLMSRVELLTVENSFQISGLGVVIIPDFSVPDGWQHRKESVTVATPDGEQFEAIAQFNIWHFNIPDPEVSDDRRWRVVVLLPDRTKDELPAGSRIMVSPELRDAILPHNAA
jgi:hypothetical protein